MGRKKFKHQTCVDSYLTFKSSLVDLTALAIPNLDEILSVVFLLKKGVVDLNQDGAVLHLLVQITSAHDPVQIYKIHKQVGG